MPLLKKLALGSIAAFTLFRSKSKGALAARRPTDAARSSVDVTLAASDAAQIAIGSAKRKARRLGRR
ncbi:MAG: hypothetical protein ABIY55_32435 [Kofleriaceae bacterium]